MSEESRAFWNSQLDNAATVPDFSSWPLRYAELSHTVRRRWGEGERLPVGPEPGQAVWRVATGRSDRAMVFIHGGYWRRYEAADFAFVAAAAHAANATLYNVDYRLMPAVRLADAVMDAVAASAVAVAEAERTVLVGHSAGAHLAVEAALRLSAGVAGVVGISGLYDLAPLRHAAIQDEIALTMQEVADFSPQVRAAHITCALTLAAGAEETVEFRRQSAMLHDAVIDSGGQSRLSFVADRHHSSIVSDLADPTSAVSHLIAQAFG